MTHHMTSSAELASIRTTKSELSVSSLGPGAARRGFFPEVLAPEQMRGIRLSGMPEGLVP